MCPKKFYITIGAYIYTDRCHILYCTCADNEHNLILNIFIQQSRSGTRICVGPAEPPALNWMYDHTMLLGSRKPSQLEANHPTNPNSLNNPYNPNKVTLIIG